MAGPALKYGGLSSVARPAAYALMDKHASAPGASTLICVPGVWTLICGRGRRCGAAPDPVNSSRRRSGGPPP